MFLFTIFHCCVLFFFIIFFAFGYMLCMGCKIYFYLCFYELGYENKATFSNIEFEILL